MSVLPSKFFFNLGQVKRPLKGVSGLGDIAVNIVGRGNAKELASFNLNPNFHNRIPPKTAYDIVLKLHDRNSYLGGVVTTALATAAALGVPSHLYATVGDDQNGQFLIDEVKNRNITPNITVTKGNTALNPVMVLNDGESASGSLVGVSYDIREPGTRKLQGSKMFLTSSHLIRNPENFNVLREAFFSATKAGAKSILMIKDPLILKECREHIKSFYEKDIVDTCIGNKNDFAVLFNIDRFPEDTLMDRVVAHARETGKHFVITNGSRDIALINNKQVTYIPPERVLHSVNKNGASNVFVGGYIAGLAYGMQEIDAIRTGSKAAKEIIERLDPTPNEDIMRDIKRSLKTYFNQKRRLSLGKANPSTTHSTGTNLANINVN
ncbi:MAG: carbohydrate kinase family protein [Pseudomonadota bacterium]